MARCGRILALLSLATLLACASETPAQKPKPKPGPGALSTNLTPRQAADHYVAQAHKYFDTFDTSADPNSIPAYSARVARWEWPPWLKLTGLYRDDILAADNMAMIGDPSTVPVRECKAFSVQPFARCYVSFHYKGGACPIYEEFTFNDAGEVTFIEAWSDQPGLAPTSAADRWALRAGVHRMSTKIPGLGDPEGLIDLDAAWMQAAADKDAEVADFVMRAKDFWTYWEAELKAHGPDVYKHGCGWK